MELGVPQKIHKVFNLIKQLLDRFAKIGRGCIIIDLVKMNQNLTNRGIGISSLSIIERSGVHFVESAEDLLL